MLASEKIVFPIIYPEADNVSSLKLSSNTTSKS